MDQNPNIKFLHAAAGNAIKKIALGMAHCWTFPLPEQFQAVGLVMTIDWLPCVLVQNKHAIEPADQRRGQITNDAKLKPARREEITQAVL